LSEFLDVLHDSLLEHATKSTLLKETSRRVYTYIYINYIKIVY